MPLLLALPHWHYYCTICRKSEYSCLMPKMVLVAEKRLHVHLSSRRKLCCRHELPQLDRYQGQSVSNASRGASSSKKKRQMRGYRRVKRESPFQVDLPCMEYRSHKTSPKTKKMSHNCPKSWNGENRVSGRLPSLGEELLIESHGIFEKGNSGKMKGKHLQRIENLPWCKR